MGENVLLPEGKLSRNILEKEFINRLSSMVYAIDGFDKSIEACGNGPINTHAECMVDTICAIDYAFQNLERMNLTGSQRGLLAELEIEHVNEIRNFNERRKEIKINEGGEIINGIARSREIADRKKYDELESEFRELLIKLKKEILEIKNQGI